MTEKLEGITRRAYSSAKHDGTIKAADRLTVRNIIFSENMPDAENASSIIHCALGAFALTEPPTRRNLDAAIKFLRPEYGDYICWGAIIALASYWGRAKDIVDTLDMFASFDEHDNFPQSRSAARRFLDFLENE